MKHRFWTKLLGLALAFVMLVAPVATMAAEPPEGVEVTDMYSSWAELDVFMAGTAYQLGDEGTYSNFRGGLTGPKFTPVYADMAETFGVEGGFAPTDGQMTRGAVVAALYEIISGTAVPETEAAGYFINNGLIAGRGAGDNGLDKICTVEEMLVLAVRVYEHVVYKAGDDTKGFFWEVRGGANKAYLLGSIHVSDGTMYPLNKAIESAFAGAGSLAVEADIYNITALDQTLMQAMIFEMGMIDASSGKSIKDFISEDTYALMAKVFDSLGIPAEAYDQMKPWMAYMALTGVALQGGDADAALGLDMYFLMKAYASGKPVVELEGAAFQFNMFNSMSPALQENMLLGTLYAIDPTAMPGYEADGEDPAQAADSMLDGVSVLLDVVKTGDDATINEMLGGLAGTEDPLAQELNKALLTDRNKGMAEKIDQLMKAGGANGDCFVIVGALHMLGDDGLVKLLTDMGYEVRRVK
jgi:uncharacterized protein YbaP (TraB family)